MGRGRSGCYDIPHFSQVPSIDLGLGDTLQCQLVGRQGQAHMSEGHGCSGQAGLHCRSLPASPPPAQP